MLFTFAVLAVADGSVGAGLTFAVIGAVVWGLMIALLVKFRRAGHGG